MLEYHSVSSKFSEQQRAAAVPGCVVTLMNVTVWYGSMHSVFHLCKDNFMDYYTRLFTSISPCGETR